MEPNYKLSRQQKIRLITRYLPGCWPYFAVGLACACLSMALNALTPQIIKVTVDSVLGDKPAGLPVFLQNWLGWETLR